MMNSVSVQEAVRWLEERDGFLILTHRRPDGDTIGCAAGLCKALRERGKTAWLLPNEDASSLFIPYLEGVQAPDGFVPSCTVSVDISSEGLFPGSAGQYKGKVDLAIDHHPSNEGFARVNCVEPDKAACGEILYEIAARLAGASTVSPEVALPLYLAVSTDTGCFVYANTTANTHRVAAALMETGIDYRAVNKRHFRTKSWRRLRVEARILETMELHDGGETALSSIRLADLAEFGATEADIDDISAFTGQLEGVRTAVTIREIKGGECKVSVRTQGNLNASHVCARLGGGGHAMAAGCMVKGGVDDAKRALLDAIRAARAESGAGSGTGR